jgi:hypothetical protein
VLALPGAAAAKEITAVSVCGAHACTRLTDHADMRAFMDTSGMAEAAPRAPQRSYLLRMRVSEPGSPHIDWTSHWLPDAGLIASSDESTGLVFTAVDPPLARVLRRAARGHAARPARRFVRHLPTARVDEIVEPPAPSPPATAAAGGGPPSLAWAGLGALLLLAAAGVVRGVRARRRVGSPPAPAAPRGRGH